MRTPRIATIATIASCLAALAAPSGAPAGAGAHAARACARGSATARRMCRARLLNVFAGASLYVDPDSRAAEQARRWRASRPADAAAMDKIARQPGATWFGDWNTDVRGDVADRVAQIAAARALPLFVIYDIPRRDCGGYSAGGAPTAAAYRAWIRAFTAGLGRARAAVLLEPDALPGLDCLSSADRRTRLALIAYAVSVLTAGGRVGVYLDAGHSAWQPAHVMAERLRAAGVAGARGFSLNVSNFRDTATEVAYGRAISRMTGGRSFVVDVSRNGAGPAPGGEWCNPLGRALGAPPATRTGIARADAFLWIKAPGDSDGPCNGGPVSGEWWPEYALGLAKRAAW